VIVLPVIGAACLWLFLQQPHRAFITATSAPTGPQVDQTPARQPAAVQPRPTAGNFSLSQPPVFHAQPRAVSTPLAAGAGDSIPNASSPFVLAPRIAVQAVRSAIQKYGSTFGGNPVGTNAEITRALNGNNPTHANFLGGIPGQQINSNGELVDPWGTPYFFHQLSGSDMEVRSAGPDHIMWNADDIILK
jgi:hypothetical protein